MFVSRFMKSMGVNEGNSYVGCLSVLTAATLCLQVFAGGRRPLPGDTVCERIPRQLLESKSCLQYAGRNSILDSSAERSGRQKWLHCMLLIVITS